VISLKTAREIEVMRRANIIVAEVLQELKRRVAPGVTTLDLDAVAEELTLKKGAIPAFKGYNVAGRVYPRCLCASVNNEIVHGIPSNRSLREGDIIGLDYGVIYEGFYGDSAITVPVPPPKVPTPLVVAPSASPIVSTPTVIVNGCPA
jgi:methionyl aminopeptidase